MGNLSRHHFPMSDSPENAEWRACVGVAEGYRMEVNADGFVRRTTEFTKRGFVTKPVKRSLNASGYLKVAGAANGVVRLFPVHVLVAEAFICPRPLGKYVNHINGNKLDNRLVNLEWVTPHQNAQHAAVLRRCSPGKKVPDATIRLIRKAAKIGMSLTQICRAFEYGLQPYHVSRIINGTRRTGAYLNKKMRGVIELHQPRKTPAPAPGK